MANKNPNPSTRFKKGESGNASGRSSALQELDARFTDDLRKVWAELGAAGLRRVAEDAPAKFAELVLARLPKQASVSVDQTGTVTHEHIGVSETSRLIGEALGVAADRALPQPLPH